MNKFCCRQYFKEEDYLLTISEAFFGRVDKVCLESEEGVLLRRVNPIHSRRVIKKDVELGYMREDLFHGKYMRIQKSFDGSIFVKYGWMKGGKFLGHRTEIRVNF